MSLYITVNNKIDGVCGCVYVCGGDKKESSYGL